MRCKPTAYSGLKSWIDQQKEGADGTYCCTDKNPWLESLITKQLVTKLLVGGLFCAICIVVEGQENYGGGKKNGVARFKAQLVTLATE